MIDVFTDGGTIGKNGKLGSVSEVSVGIYIPYYDIEISQRLLGISNNEAEFKALIVAMEILVEGQVKEARFNMDSKIVVNRANGSKPRKKKFANERMDSFQDEVLALAKHFNKIEFKWIPREENAKADELSNIAKEQDLEEGEETYEDEVSKQFKQMAL